MRYSSRPHASCYSYHLKHHQQATARKPSLLANAPTIMKREAHLPKSQKALRTMVDRINAGTGERHEAQPIQCSARGSALWYKRSPFTHRRQRQLLSCNAFTEHQRQFLTEKDGTIALAAFHEFCTIIAAHPNDDSSPNRRRSLPTVQISCRKQASSN
jgi:hypothetical protein